jgi:hypothetical protein
LDDSFFESILGGFLGVVIAPSLKGIFEYML